MNKNGVIKYQLYRKTKINGMVCKAKFLLRDIYYTLNGERCCEVFSNHLKRFDILLRFTTSSKVV